MSSRLQLRRGAGERSAPEEGGAQPEDSAQRRLELVISLVLRAGVAISVALVLAGLMLTFARHPRYVGLSGGIGYGRLVARPGDIPHSISQIGRALRRGDGRGLVMLGLAVLILTPVVRVAVGVVGFLLRRDLPMALVTAFVLTVLLLSFVLAGV